MLTIKDGVVASALSVLNQVSRRLMGIVSLVILARILTPADFGLVAIALIFLNFINVVSQIGSSSYLLSREEINNEMLHTSWTLGFFIKNSVVLCLAIASPFIANYYDDPRLIPILLMFAFQGFLGSLYSPGIVYKQKNQQLKEITQWQIISRFVTTLFTIGVAVIFESYWALVLGQFVSVLSYVVSTYCIAPLKPKFSLSNLKPQWQFSKWIIPQSLINFFRSQIDAIYASAIFDKAAMGAYNSMRYYATIPSDTFITPLLGPLLTQFSQFQNNHEYYRKQIQVSFFAVLAISLPVVYLMNTQSEYVVGLILGDKWVEYSALLGIFGLFTFVSVINNVVSQIVMLKNDTRLLLIYSVIAILCNVAMFALVDFDDIFDLAKYKIGLDLTLSVVFLIFVFLFLLGSSTLVHVSHPIFMAIICIFLAGYVADNLPSVESEFLNFAFYCATTLLVYGLALLSVIYLLKNKVYCYSYTFNVLKKSSQFVREKIR